MIHICKHADHASAVPFLHTFHHARTQFLNGQEMLPTCHAEFTNQNTINIVLHAVSSVIQTPNNIC